VVDRLPYPHPTSAAATAVMRGNRRSNTKPEVLVRSLLHRSGYRFRRNLSIETDGLRVRPDIVFVRQRLAIFIDGCFWHCCPEHGNAPLVNTSYWGPKLERNVLRDRRVDECLRQAGWMALRIWEHIPPMEAASQIVEALEQLKERSIARGDAGLASTSLAGLSPDTKEPGRQPDGR
jgi:DNA mismatch endonuclease, patch repair protein